MLSREPQVHCERGQVVDAGAADRMALMDQIE
jgi:hypothetical protein